MFNFAEVYVAKCDFVVNLSTFAPTKVSLYSVTFQTVNPLILKSM